MKYLILILSLTLGACTDFTSNNPPRSGALDKRPSAQQPGGNAPNPQKPLPPELLLPNEGKFSKEKMLYNLGQQIATKTKEFHIETQILSLAFENSCGELSNEGWKKLQNHVKSTILKFQPLWSLPIGPLTDNNKFLLDQIYSWPFVNYCGIDREVARTDAARTPTDNLIYTGKGLAALEYLLFEDSLKSVCNPRAYPETKLWSEKSSTEKRQMRCTMAAQLAKDVENKASRLWESWNPQQGHFAKTLVDGSRYNTAQAALNDLSDHLFRHEIVKDQKLGRPLGRHKDCLNGVCPEQAELRYSGLSFAAISENLKMQRLMFWGSSSSREEKGFGLDEGLQDLGRKDIADRWNENLARAIAQAEALRDTSMQDILATMDQNECARTTWDSRLVPACALFQDTRQLTIILKSDFLSVFDLRPPKTIEGDND